jgi:hypothetical protein
MSTGHKKTDHSFIGPDFKYREGRHKNSFSILNLFKNGHTFIPLISGVIQLKIGSILVFFSILGMVEPLWISAILSIFGSILFMLGGFLIYHTVTGLGSFDSLVSQAVRKAVRFQN